MKEPRLRFKEFKDEWQTTKSGELLKNVSIKNNEHLKVLSSTQKHGMVYRDDLGRDTKYSKESLSNYKLVKPGDVIISLRSFQGGFEISDKQGIVSPAYTVMKFNSDNFNHDNYYYWKTFFKSHNFIQLLKKATYGVRDGKSISYKDFSSLKITYANTDEQRKIGSFFSYLDDQIELQSNKLESFKRAKKGYLQKMFPSYDSYKPKLRLKGFNDNWEKVKLEEVGSIKSGYGFPDKEQNGTKGTPFYKVSDMAKNYNVMTKSSNYVTNEQIENNKWKVVKPINDSVIFAKVGAALNKNRKRLVKTSFLMDNNLMSYSFDDSWNSYFGFTLFKNIYLPKFAQTGALPSFNASDIGDIRVYKPSLKEQQMIGMFFKNLDKQIELQQNKLKDLKDQKKAYLQKMFI